MTTSRKEGQGTEQRQRRELHAIRLTPAERAELNRRAEAAGMSVAAYVRHQALGAAGPRSGRRLSIDAVLIRQLIGQLGYVGNNLNQLTRLANMGDLEEPAELIPVLRKIDEAADACMTALGRDS
jgi:hypothetical protein